MSLLNRVDDYKDADFEHLT